MLKVTSCPETDIHHKSPEKCCWECQEEETLAHCLSTIVYIGEELNIDKRIPGNCIEVP